MTAAFVALSCSAGAQSPVVFTSVATGLSSPVDIQYAPGDSTRLFIVQQGGQLRVIENGALLPTPALNVSTRIVSGGERGFLGLAFDPLWPDSAYIYVNFTRTGDGANSVVRYTRSAIGTGVSFDLATERVLMTIPDFASNHNAGALAFGDDGYLYITTGDGGSGGDPQNNGQTLTALLGKILRIDVRGSQPTSECTGGSTNYGIPPDNPFVGSTTAACDEIYAFGLRNPWRMSFDRLTNELWLGDVGQELWEEIDVVQSGGNYGWRRMEGTHCYNPSSNCQTGSLILPIWEYSSGSGSGNCSVTGGYVYRGSAVADLFGQYVFADYCSGRVWALDMSGPSPTATQIGTRSSPTTFGEDYHGEMYVVGGSSIFRLDPNPVYSEPQPDESAVQMSLEGPNPVRSRATIRFHAGLPGPARMTLFDVLGRQVAVLFERVVDGTTPQEVLLRADGLPPGVYVVRLVTAAGLRTMEVVLAR
jgi:glucose/arabinose dehydrogenase